MNTGFTGDDEGEEPREGEPGEEEPRRRVRLVKKAAPKKRRVVLRRRAEEPDAAGDGAEVMLDEQFEASLEGVTADEEGLSRLAKVLAADFVPAVAKRILESGGAVLSEELVRRALADTPVPKEVGSFLAGSAGTMRREVNRVIAREVAGMLKSVNLTGELQKILTSMSLEIKTEIRFVPNDRAAKGEGEPSLKPELKSRAQLKRDGGGLLRRKPKES